jgi:hypothetical protein
MKEKITDERFAHLYRDPRFRRINKKKFKLKVDERFKTMFTEEKFKNSSVDKYGRPVYDENEEIKRFYELETCQEEGVKEKRHSKDYNLSNNNYKQESKFEASEIEESDFDPARGVGLLESSEEEDSTLFERESSPEDEQEECEYGEETKRFAICNLDWKFVTASHLYVLLNSFKPLDGAIYSVKIFVSEYGKKRLEKEAMIGPILFDSDESSIEQDSAQQEVCNGEDEIDTKRIMKYHVRKRKYYFAVCECDSINTAKVIYNECDGQEFETSGDIMDLRYIPDDLCFTDEPKDTCTSNPGNFQPLHYHNSLQNFKAKFDWDDEDPERARVLKKRLTKEEVEHMDFANYLASCSSDSEIDEVERQNRYQQLLNGISLEESGAFKNKKNTCDGDIQVTFRPGLTSKTQELVERRIGEIEDKEKSLWQKYLDKKKKLRKERRKQARHLHSSNGNKINHTGDDNLIQQNEVKKTPLNNKKSLKQESLEELKEKAQLELLLLDEDHVEGHTGKHFNMKDIEKQQNTKRSKKKRQSKSVEDEFKLNVQDDRFKAIFENKDYAIDKTHGSFKNTQAMREFLSQKNALRHKSKLPHSPPSNESPNNYSIFSLVESVKRKTQQRLDSFSKNKKAAVTSLL